ncbi:helix-turn-helix domain-containing protein [Tessaracoccus oleiagri]|uniref:Helix-turn-helix domain-containing protein n=1 Tax=Tessaracoccus oleiagri TaxID=686624 RepID=A0A1G9L6Q8_9ACTN|nr:helix-turn-helix domain-containing protein [Tessaracoccus oleiagri]SDL57668.1 Helix-turn-helix domain-containing protein [Tessaracoccus oleiagri]
MKGILIRQVVGEVLREMRADAGMTLRQVSMASMVSLGYLSEIERGHKEASSEVLNSIVGALGSTLSELLGAVTIKVASQEISRAEIGIAA